MRPESGAADNLAAPPGGVFSVRGRLLLDGRITQGVVVVQNGRIIEVRTGDLASNIPKPVQNAHYVSPGLIDLQINGAFGHEVGGDAEALAGLAAAPARYHSGEPLTSVGRKDVTPVAGSAAARAASASASPPTS